MCRKSWNLSPAKGLLRLNMSSPHPALVQVCPGSCGVLHPGRSPPWSVFSKPCASSANRCQRLAFLSTSRRTSSSRLTVAFAMQACFLDRIYCGTHLESPYDRPSHRVFCTFFLRSGWQVQFVEADLKTPLPRMFTFADLEKIRELARRCEASATSQARQVLEYAIENGRGGFCLNLTPTQMRSP